MSRKLVGAVALVALIACSDDTKARDGGPILEASPGDASGTLDKTAPADGNKGTCGGVVCGAGSVCCGPPACGFCISDNSGAECASSCPDAGTDFGLPGCAQAPTGFCDVSTAESCRHGIDICQCIAVCSGRRPPPGEEYKWACAPAPDARCPQTAPQMDDACAVAGLVCSYGNCGVITATCTDGKWHVKEVGPPP